MTNNQDLKLLLYDSELNIIDSTTNIVQDIGTVVISNLIPNTEYPYGSFFVSWVVNGRESNKFPVQSFNTKDNETSKILNVKSYYKDTNNAVDNDVDNESTSNNVIINGKSAYDIALDNGFKGTEKEWLESLKGKPGTKGEPFTYNDFTQEQLDSLKGEKGDPFTYIDFTQEQLEKLKGEQGKSAYDLAKNHGFEGTEKEWLDSLKGEKGDPFTYNDFTQEQLNALKVHTSASGDTIVESPLSGLTGVFIGDSITEVNARTRKNYHQFIADRNNMKNINLGHSGTGFQDRYNSVAEIKEQPDFISVKMGTNDYGLVGGKTRPLGTAENLEMNTVARLIYYTFLQLSISYPTTPIVVLTPLPRKESNPFKETKNELGYTLGELVEVLTKIAHKFSFPVLDLYNESNLRVWDDNVNGIFFSYDENDPSKADGLHPNYKGHQLISYQIEDFLKSKAIVGEKINYSSKVDTSLKTISKDKGVYSKTVKTYGIFWKKDQSMIFNIYKDEVDLTGMKVIRVDHKGKTILNASGIASNSPYFYTLPNYDDKDSGFNRTTQVTDFADSFELMDNFTERGNIYMSDYITLYYTDIKNGNIVGDTNSTGFRDTNTQSSTPSTPQENNTTNNKVLYTTNNDGTYNLDIPKEAVSKISWKKDQSFMIHINHGYTKDIDFGNSYIYDTEINGKKISVNYADAKYNVANSGDYFYYLTVPSATDGTSNNRTSQVQEIVNTLTEKGVENGDRVLYEPTAIKLRLKKI